MKKVICKQLRTIAAGLPFQAETLPGTLGMKTLRVVRDKQGRQYFGLMTADVTNVRPVNHYRRLKKAFKKGGKPAVIDYSERIIAQAQKAGYTTQFVQPEPPAPVAQDPRDMPGQLAAPGAQDPQPQTTKRRPGRPKKEVQNG